MGNTDKARNALDDMKGSAKEAVGKVTDNEDLEAEGRADQAGAQARKAGEDLKDAAGSAKEGVKDALDR